ncbi:MAG: SIR2 family protein [Bacteroidota bacterium]
MSNPLYQFLSLDTNSPMCSDNIVFLLGAGASIDAGIPTLNKMMQLYEEKKLRVDRKDGKKVNEKLYDYFKRRSASRQYSLNSSANIEDMLAVMEDFIQMQEGKKPMYNLVGNWDKELMAIIGYNFNDIVVLRDDLKKHVIEQLTEEWKGDKGKQLDYFHFLFYLQAQIGGVMKIFTLNHDRSIEESYRRYYASHFNPGGGEPKEATLLETGFGDKIIRNNEYEYRPDMFFDPGNFDVEKKAIKLYKLHGSIDWQTENEDRIRLVKKPAVSEVIFGISQKYKSEEPYSLLYPEFKKALAGTGTQARMLVIVGYSFNDPHINDAIRAAMHSNSKLKILICEPGLCETQYFGLPQTSNDPGNAACEFIKNITKSEDYETYINMSVMLHSVYYSRNFDEDALFLSACLNTGDMILKTKARDKHQGGKFGKRILQNILTQNTEIAMLEKYFQQPHAGISKQERNHYVYCNMPGLSISYKEVLNCIDETKVKVYGIQKKYDIDLRGSKGQAGDAVAAENEIKAALELIDDLRMVEKFIKEFIPVHLSMMYGLIEQ